jgi:hypothetical protein
VLEGRAGGLTNVVSSVRVIAAVAGVVEVTVPAGILVRQISLPFKYTTAPSSRNRLRFKPE